MRPFSRSRPRVEQLVVYPLLAGEVDLHQRGPAVLGHLRDRPVAGDAGVVDDDVDAAGKRVRDPRRRVLGGDVELDRLAAEPLRRPPRRSSRELRHVEPDDAGAVAARASRRSPRRSRARRR